MKNKEEIINDTISFYESSDLNKAGEIGLKKIFDIPLIGFADAKDPLYDELKKDSVISPNHMSPLEWLSGAKSVISFFLPYSKDVKVPNRVDGLPSVEWLYGRIEGQIFLDALVQNVYEKIIESGSKAVCPSFDSRFKVIDRKSNWSERHNAYIAGLGTFGLSKSLITKSGSAGRFGSIIVDFQLEQTKREYSGVYDYCNNCKQCIPRCPSNAIAKEGKNTSICADYIDNLIKPKFKPRYGCGKCQTGVMCENAIP